jgi:Flp pilus assembly protein CpaB
MSRTTSLLPDLIRAAGRHRRLIASLAAAAAVYCTVSALSPGPPPTVAVLAAARDLPGGTVPSAGDLRTVRLPAAIVPDGALRPGSAVASRLLAGPVRAGEPLTDARFMSPGLVRRAGAGRIAYPMRIADAETVALIRTGDRVDVLSASATGRRAADTVASGVTVIGLPAPARDSAGRGALVVVAVPAAVAAELAQAEINGRLSVALTGSPP